MACSVYDFGDRCFQFLAAPAQNLASPAGHLSLAPPSIHASRTTTLSRRQEQKFAALVEGLVVLGERARMTDCLKAVKEPRDRTERNVDGKTPSKVRQIGGKLPRVKSDWDMLKGPHGGGTGDGLPHARFSFLREVWSKYSLARC